VSLSVSFSFSFSVLGSRFFRFRFFGTTHHPLIDPENDYDYEKENDAAHEVAAGAGQPLPTFGRAEFRAYFYD
jgi:hypothetical protein